MVKRIVTNRNIRQKSYELIRDHIVSNEVPPGTKINEGELARELGVSKTPVREALSKLAHEGIVEIIPNRGYDKPFYSPLISSSIMFKKKGGGIQIC